MAAASLFVLDLPRDVYDANTEPMLSHINVGSGADITIFDLAQLVARAVGFDGDINIDPSKPDGAMCKLMDVSRLARMGWTARIPLDVGVRDTLRWYMDHRATARV
jgi:GDP-L-fucose synthase